VFVAPAFQYSGEQAAYVFRSFPQRRDFDDERVYAVEQVRAERELHQIKPDRRMI